METGIINTEQVKAEVMPVVQTAGTMVIQTAENYTFAAGFLKQVKAAQKKVDDTFDGTIQSTHKAWKDALALKQTFEGPLKSAETTIKQKMLTFQQEQERIRLEEQRRLQAKADEEARREREKNEAAARLQREKELAAQREADEARRKAQEEQDAVKRVALQKEAEKRQAEATAAAAKAEAKEEAAAQVTAPVIQVASITPIIKGQVTRTAWKATVTDKKAAIAAVLQWPDYGVYITLEAGELNKFAARTKGQVSITGLTFAEESTMSSTSR